MDLTETKSAFNLNSINEQFPSIIQHVSVAVAVFRGLDFIVEAANQAYLEIVDKEAHNFIGRPLFDHIPEAKETVEPLLRNVYKTGVPFHGNEFPVRLNRHGHSQLTYFNFVYQPAFNAQGEISGVIVVGSEVTQMVIAKQQLAESEKQFRNLVMQSPIAMAILKGKDLIIDLANPAAIETIWRNKAEDLIGKKLLEVFPELKEQKYPQLLLDVFNTGKPYSESEAPVFLTGKDGVIKLYFDLSCAPLFDVENNVFAIMTTAYDVTEKVQVRQNIEKAEQRSRLAIESADLGTYEVDMVTNNISTSQRFNDIWGVEHSLSRSGYTAMIHPDDRAVREQAHAMSLRTGNLQYEARVIQKDKSERWVKIDGKVLFDSKGRATTLLGVVQDISKHKAFTENLARQVQERTEELQALNEELVATNEELSASNEQLVKANQELKQFAYVASHDLQEPLRKIQIFANILQERFSNEIHPDALVYLGKISASSTRMSMLIRDLLDYSRLAHNKSLFQQVDLNTVLTNVLSDFEWTIKQKNISIHAAPLPTIQAIPIQMNQLLYNLINNSIKFLRKNVESKIEITSRLLTEADITQYPSLKGSGPHHEISVCDNGIGFSQQYAEQIFLIFQTLNHKSAYGGYGIGLALCKRIVENHNGIIFARARENEGATFTFILPQKH